MTILKQSTQAVVRIGPFVDVGDGFTPETGITLGAADEAEALKAAGAATADISAATWAAISGADGWYDLTLTTAHTDTIGDLTIVVHDDSVCLPVFARFQVVEEDTYNYLYASGSAPDTQIAAIKTVVDAIPTTAMRGTDSAATASALATVDGIVDNILLDTAEIGTAGVGLTDLGGMSTTMKGQINTEADTALTDYDPPTNTEMEARTLVAASYFDPAADTVATVTTVTNQHTLNEISDGVWNEARSGHTTAGTYGESHGSVISGTASGTPTTTTMVSDVSIGADDQLKGRIIIFIGNTTTNLTGQATDITGGTNGTNELTFTALTNAPVSGDKFIIV